MTDITHIKRDGVPLIYLIAENKIVHYEQALSTGMIKSNNILLSKKEVKILSLISQGYTSKEIADLTQNKISTIYTQRKNIRSKYKMELSKLIIQFKERGII